MPLYPHSILKKPSMARVTSQPTYVQDEPLIDYDTDVHKHEETKRMDNKSSTPGGVKSGQSSSALLNEDIPLDRPLATPGKHIFLKVTFLPDLNLNCNICIYPALSTANIQFSIYIVQGQLLIGNIGNGQKRQFLFTIIRTRRKVLKDDYNE